MSAPQQRKVLKIGIIQGGRITEEQTIKFGQPVSIGDGAKNTFVLHSSGLPARFVIFPFQNGQYSLVFTEEMDGKLSIDGGGVMNFEAVRAKSTRQKEGGFLFPLTEQVRGRITVGNYTIIFQWTLPPAPAARGSNKDFVGSLWATIDSTYWGTFAISSVLHASIMMYSLSLPPPPEITLETMPERFTKFIVPPKAPPVEAPKVDEGKGEEEVKKEDEPKKDEKKEPEKDTKKTNEPPKDTKPVDPAVKAEQTREALKKVGLMKLLASRTGSGGAVSDIIGGEVGNTDMSKLLNSDIAGTRVAQGSERVSIVGDKNDTSLRDVKDVDTIGQAAEVKTAVRQKAKVPKVETANAEVEGNMDRNSVETVIKKNIGGVTRCYEQALNTNPSLSGKITIDFTVEPSGRVSRVDVRGPDQDLETCIKGKVKRWVFPASEEGPADISFTSVLTASE